MPEPSSSLLSDDALIRRFGHDTFVRGRTYALEGRVGSLGLSGELMAVATVTGGPGRVYQTSAVLSPTLSGTCSCPMRANCKHVVALLIRLRERTVTPGDRAPSPAWQSALTPLLRTPAPDADQALALVVTLSGGLLTLRPLRRGARDRWVKTGASWGDLQGGYRHAGLDPEQVRALVALADVDRGFGYGYSGYARSGEALLFNRLDARAWPALQRVVDAGVELMARPDGPGDPGPILWDAVEPTLHLTKTATGLRLRPSFVGDLPDATFGPREATLLGRPAHGLAVVRGDALLLAPLTRPLSDAEQPVFAGSGLAIPDADVALFATGFLPRLRTQVRVSVDDGVVLPEADPPRLVCRVTFSDAPAHPMATDAVSTAVVDWGFRYRVGDAVTDLGVRPQPGEPPVRQPDAEARLAASVPAGPWTHTTLSGASTLVGLRLVGRGLFAFVGETLPGLQARDDVVVELNRDAPEFREASEAPLVTLRVGEDEGDWFSLGVEVSINGERVPLAELLRALTLRDDHLLLGSGTWFDLDRPELDQLRALIAEASLLGDQPSDGTFRLRPEHAGLWEELVSLGVVAEQAASWRASVDALLGLTELPAVPTPAGLAAELRPYQDAGLRWLSFLWRTRLGGVLADEMGLGKTLQTLALVQSVVEAGELDHPVLVVAPTSVIPTWVAEARRFAPELTVVAITETERRRGVPLADAVAPGQLVVTSFALLRLEADDYAGLPWSMVLLDEAQQVKNHASQAYRAVRRLKARLMVALTGTPLENNLMDLWSILSITAPGLFPDPASFTERYRRPIEGGDADALARLHRRIRPLLLRRTKAAVASELPDKQEQIVPVELTPTHRRLYDRHLTKERQKVLKLVDDLRRNRITILASLTLLRQLALSPVLIDPSYTAESAKLDALVEWLGELASEGHRALVFSQYTGFLRLARERLTRAGISTEYLDGRTRDRGERIAAFREGDATAFLISLKAGGFGLTLTEADYVFILDPWWNPAAEAQAVDRTHRIGQDKPVNVYRFVSSDTIEEKVVALQQRKRDLFDAVVASASDVAAPLSASDIRGLLDVD